MFKNSNSQTYKDSFLIFIFIFEHFLKISYCVSKLKKSKISMSLVIKANLKTI